MALDICLPLALEYRKCQSNWARWDFFKLFLIELRGIIALRLEANQIFVKERAEHWWLIFIVVVWMNVKHWMKVADIRNRIQQ